MTEEEATIRQCVQRQIRTRGFEDVCRLHFGTVSRLWCRMPSAEGALEKIWPHVYISSVVSDPSSKGTEINVRTDEVEPSMKVTRDHT